MKQLTVGDIVKEAVGIGLKNVLPLFVNALLWGLTIWIPYLNVGTTIGMVTLPAKMARGEELSMTEIFNPEYRKLMGEFFLIVAFVGIGTLAGYVFFIVPALVISIAWSLAVLLVIDKSMEPLAAIKKSNELTYGKKWIIFGGQVVLNLLLMIAIGIIAQIGMAIHPVLGGLLTIVGIVFYSAITMGATAYIYKTLTATN